MSGAPTNETPGARLTPAQLDQLVSAIPYARLLGAQCQLKGDELTLVLPYKESNIGNPALPALHGGAVGAFMELCAGLTLCVAQRQMRMPKTIDISIDYLRSGRPVDTFARAHVTKLGRRIANVRVEAWQFERADPIAALHGHFLVRQPDEAE